MNPVLKRTLTGLTVGAVVILAVLLAPGSVIMPIGAVLILLAGCEFSALYSRKVRLGGTSGGALLLRLAGFLAGWIAIASGLWMLFTIPSRYGDAACGPFRLGNVMLLYVISIVKFSDVGGFAFGLSTAKLMKNGNHKMCPSISPNKSWEGMAGSVFASCLVSVLWAGVTNFSPAKSIALGTVAAVVGTFGDLIESKFKRWVGVKDSSTMKITNGMGGFLDMFDSLLLAPALIASML